MKKFTVSSRALNPLSKHENPEKTFCDLSQAKATTATRFFRDEEMLNGLKNEVVKAYLQKTVRKGLDVWSAGCSSGEEAYSLACLGLSIFQHRKERSSFLVYGTDISADQLKKGKIGRYLKNSSSVAIKKYSRLILPYATIGNDYIQMGSEIRSKVKFGKFDLRRRPRKHTFDYITCNHVFQYYDYEAQINFVNNFLSVLKPDGLIFIEGLTAEAFNCSQLSAVDGYKNLFKRTL